MNFGRAYDRFGRLCQARQTNGVDVALVDLGLVAVRPDLRDVTQKYSSWAQTGCVIYGACQCIKLLQSTIEVFGEECGVPRPFYPLDNSCCNEYYRAV